LQTNPANPQLTMEFDANNTPFIRLPAPLTNIIIAPPLYSDGEAVIKIFNDPRVYMNLLGPPFPFMQKDWDERFALIQKSSSDALIQFREVVKSRAEGGAGDGRKPGSRWVDAGSPVSAIRELDPVTGEQNFIGSIGFAKRKYPVLESEEEKKRNIAVDGPLETGVPEMPWSMGFYLAPSHHGRGIMTAAVGALINDFMIPYMNVDFIAGSYFDHNSASRKVFERNGFVFWKTVEEAFELQESKTGVKGKKVGAGFMRWTRNP